MNYSVVRTRANVRRLSGVDCDSAWLVVDGDDRTLYTDFRYIPMVRRMAPGLKVVDCRKLKLAKRSVGFEKAISVAEYERLRSLAPKGTRFRDVTGELQRLRAVKTAEEIGRVRAAAALNDRIWQAAVRRFKAGMTERRMALEIRRQMLERGDGEAFETIVCVGRNAAECHHVPDGTVWDGESPVLVDMGVKLGGYCSDMTRCFMPKAPARRYREIYGLVLKANRAAIAAARPGMTGRALDKAARDVIAKAGYGKAFGHSLGHGVGLEVHEAPYASPKSDWVLEPGMIVTVEPGVYLEGELGVRIEDLVLITGDGCETLSRSAK